MSHTYILQGIPARDIIKSLKAHRGSVPQVATALGISFASVDAAVRWYAERYIEPLGMNAPVVWTWDIPDEPEQTDWRAAETALTTVRSWLLPDTAPEDDPGARDIEAILSAIQVALADGERYEQRALDRGCDYPFGGCFLAAVGPKADRT